MSSIEEEHDTPKEARSAEMEPLPEDDTVLINDPLNPIQNATELDASQIEDFYAYIRPYRARTVIPRNETTEQAMFVDDWEITTPEQLRQNVESQPDSFLEMLNELRYQRDVGMFFASQYETLISRTVRNTVALDQLKESRSKDRARIAELTAEANINTQGNGRQPTRSSSSQPPYSKRSKALPSPEKFSNGENPTWESWVTDVRDIMLHNDDHFASEAHKVVHVAALTTGEAKDHLTSYRNSGKRDFQTVEDVLSYLADMYATVDRESDALAELEVLHMANTDKFASFFSQFVKLINILEFNFTAAKRELLNKIPNRLNAVYLASSTDFRSLQDFRDLFIRADNKYHSDQKRKDLLRPRVEKTASSALRQIHSSPLRITDGTKATYTPQRQSSVQPPPAGNRTVQQCYKCGEFGHISPNCTKPAKPDLRRQSREPSAKINNVGDDDIGDTALNEEEIEEIPRDYEFLEPENE